MQVRVKNKIGRRFRVDAGAHEAASPHLSGSNSNTQQQQRESSEKLLGSSF